ncbi:hypothetical protein Lfu02_22050 [Longispora fulva]|uniref:Beta-lactamase class A n=1 Tax=Longispora fulva TaxID=619741 RepID=A0A8J7GY21_9ACTN|nr:hypothetical protein [Longispora fulva]MBG6139783.1 hypothetical protein [Longispora fulva]GIG57833.1 hypothetical protein Lfu02_22050 [Longispora fulva]
MKSAATLGLALVLTLAGCAVTDERGPATAAPTARPTAVSPIPALSSPRGAEATPGCGGWPCEWAARFQQATARIAASPGQLGLVLRDRVTGATWQAGAADQTSWTGSTIKLAMAVYVLEQSRAGAVTLGPGDREDIADMLSVSDDEAADRIWAGFGEQGMLPVFQGRYGMSGLAMEGENDDWGALVCRPDDLANLMAYVLGSLNSEDRAYVVGAMRHVAEIQHWGVWSVGPALEPGVKNGWLEDSYDDESHWDTSTVGFVGAGQRYILAIMYQMPTGEDSLERGVRTLSDLAAALFGQATPAPAVVRPS